MTEPTTVRPSLVPAHRILGIDLARAVAILGMVLVNYSIALSGFDADGSAGTWWAQQCTGRASALFVVLAGVGISLLTARAIANGDHSGARARLLYRAAFLFALGLAFVPIWSGDILHYYGVYLAIAAAVITAPSALLWALGVAAIASFVGLAVVIDYGAGWDWSTIEYPPFWEPAGFIRNLLFNGFHPVVPWIAFLFAGMAIGRLDLDRRRTRLTMLIAGAVVFALAMGVAHWMQTLVRESAAFDSVDGEGLLELVGTSSMPPVPFYVLQAGSLAVAILGACLELGSILSPRLLYPLCATGQLALTLYILHVLGLGVIEEIYGELGTFSAGFAAEASMWFFVLSIAFASLWRWKFRYGPLEWVMRSVKPRQASD